MIFLLRDKNKEEKKKKSLKQQEKNDSLETKTIFEKDQIASINYQHKHDFEGK